MECKEIREELSTFIDGRLDSGQAAEIKDHLKQCQACKKEYQALKAVRVLLRSMPEVPAPPDFLVTLRQRLDAREPFWKKAVGFLDRGLAAMPLRAMSAAAALVLVIVVVLASSDHLGTKNQPLAHNETTYELAGATDSIPAELASTNPGVIEADSAIETPTDFVMQIVRSDPAFNNYKILPHPKGLGVLVDTPDKLYEIVIDPVEFQIIKASIEHLGGRMPETLKEARMLYPIYVRELPSPTKPLANDK